MSNIIIPKELPELIDGIHFWRSKRRDIRNRSIDSERHHILDKLRSLSTPSELEKRLIEQLAAEEQKFMLNGPETDKEYREKEIALYEKVRLVCKDMLLGKYIKHITAWYTIYMRVDKVSMTSGNTVYISGKSISFYREHDTFQWACEQQYDLLDIGKVMYGHSTPTMESIADELKLYDIMSREEVINIMKKYKDKLVKECDHIIDYAEKMEDGQMPEDVPVDTSKME